MIVYVTCAERRTQPVLAEDFEWRNFMHFEQRLFFLYTWLLNISESFERKKPTKRVRVKSIQCATEGVKIFENNRK